MCRPIIILLLAIHVGSFRSFAEETQPEPVFTLPELEPEVIAGFVSAFNSGVPGYKIGSLEPASNVAAAWTGAKQEVSSTLISELRFKRSNDSTTPESYSAAVRVEDGKLVLRHSLPLSAELRGGVALRLPSQAMKALILEGQNSSALLALILPPDLNQRSAIALCPAQPVLSTVEGDTGTINPAPYQLISVGYTGAAESRANYSVGLSSGFGQALIQVTDSLAPYENYEDSTNSSDIEVDIRRPLIKGEFLELKAGRSLGGISASSQLISAVGAQSTLRSLHATYISTFTLQNRGNIALQGSAVLVKDLNCALVVAQHLKSAEVKKAK